MNLLGKIITLMILLLSVCFLMISIMVGASHQNWKQMAMDNKAKAEQYAKQARQTMDEVQKKERAIRTEKVARMLRIQQLESQVQMALQNYTAKEKQLSDALVISQERLARAKEASERLAEQDKEVADLQAQLKTLIQDVATNREKVVDMTNRIYELEGSARNLKSMRDKLAADNALMTKVLKKNGHTKMDLTAHIEPLVSGVITDVRENTIEVNLGTDDGLNKGHRIDIFRADRFVGTARITVAEHNRSAARIDRDLTQVSPERGDRVTTNWVRTQK